MSPRLLLIDDDRDLARLLKAYMGRHGYEMDWADRPSEGLSMMASRPDLVLLDVMLPEEDGFAVCRRLREIDTATPIIMLTARGDARDRVLGLRREVPLTLSEYKILEAMTARPGKLFSRDLLLDLLDEAGASDASDRAIDVHMSRLRGKLEPDPRQPRHLHTVRGMGYRFEW